MITRDIREYPFGSGKHAVTPRDLSNVIAKRLCAHNILLCLPCLKCERYAGKDCADYEQSMLVELQKLYLDDGAKKSEAWKKAKDLLAAIKLIKGMPK